MWLPVQLDLSLLRLEHISLFAAGFIILYGLISFLMSRTEPRLRPAPVSGPPVFYAGVVWLGVVTLLAYLVIDDPLSRFGLVAASFLTLVVGIIDENRRLTPAVQFLWQVAIAALVSLGGWSIMAVSNITGEGVLNLALFELGLLIVPGSLITIAWLLLLMNAVNWLDGVDGLAAGVGTITFVTLAAISILPQVQDASTLALAAIGAGSLLAFLIWNFPPARVHLGTSGSWFLGLFIGLTAISGDGKIATTLLVLALPVIDFVFVILQRIGRGQAPWQGDTVHHLHHRLLRAHWQPRTITLGAICITIVLGATAVTLQTHQKIIALLVAAALLLLLALRLAVVQSEQHFQHHS